MIHFLGKISKFQLHLQKVFPYLCTYVIYVIHVHTYIQVALLRAFHWIVLFEIFYTSSWVKTCHNFSKTSHNKFKVVKTRWENNAWKLFLKLVETNNISGKEEWLRNTVHISWSQCGQDIFEIRIGFRYALTRN